MRDVHKVSVLLDRSSPVPLYYQLAEGIGRAITVGILRPGSWVESESRLAERHHVSIPTVRHAVALLVAKELLIRRRGIGTQVRSGPVH